MNLTMFCSYVKLILTIDLKYNEYVHRVHTYSKKVTYEYGVIYEGRNSETKHYYGFNFFFFCGKKLNTKTGEKLRYKKFTNVPSTTVL